MCIRDSYKARDGRRVRTPPALSGSDRTSRRSVGTDPSKLCALGSLPAALSVLRLCDAVAEKDVLAWTYSLCFRAKVIQDFRLTKSGPSIPRTIHTFT